MVKTGEESAATTRCAEKSGQARRADPVNRPLCLRRCKREGGVSATVFAVVKQPSGSNQGLLTAKSRLSKKGLTIPRIELVSGYMAANLVHNVKKALEGFPVNRVVGWLDSSVALHWIRGNGEYKQFVGN